MAKKPEETTQIPVAAPETKKVEETPPPAPQAAPKERVNVVEFQAPKPEDSPAFSKYLENLEKKVDKIVEKLFPPPPPPPAAPTALPEKKSFISRVLDYELY